MMLRDTMTVENKFTTDELGVIDVSNFTKKQLKHLEESHKKWVESIRDIPIQFYDEKYYKEEVKFHSAFLNSYSEEDKGLDGDFKIIKMNTKYRIYKINNSLEASHAAFDYQDKKTKEYLDLKHS